MEAGKLQTLETAKQRASETPQESLQIMEANNLHMLETENLRASEMLQESLHLDRISNLHDSILHHILAFLPAKYLARTSILSKRWLNLWITLPHLNFDSNSLYSNFYDRSPATGFMNFVDKILLCRDNSRIEKFHLSCSEECDASRIDTWVRSAITHGVQELHLGIGNMKINLSSCLFACNTLIVLKLDFQYSRNFRFPTSFSFLNLKSMHLHYITLCNNFSNQLSNCPNLENLVLHNCKVNTSTPIPISLTSQDLIANDGCYDTVTNLDNAIIGFTSNSPMRMRDGMGHCVSKIIRVLSSVKVLNLSCWTIEYLSLKQYLVDHFPKFYNLKNLEFPLYCESADVRVMTRLLESSPNLESLHLKFYGAKHRGYQFAEAFFGKKSIQEELLSNCVLGHLKLIRIKNLVAVEHHLELVNFLLEKAQALGKIIVEPRDKDPEEQNLLRQKLMTLPKSYVFDLRW